MIIQDWFKRATDRLNERAHELNRYFFAIYIFHGIYNMSYPIWAFCEILLIRVEIYQSGNVFVIFVY